MHIAHNFSVFFSGCRSKCMSLDIYVVVEQLSFVYLSFWTLLVMYICKLTLFDYCFGHNYLLIILSGLLLRFIPVNTISQKGSSLVVSSTFKYLPKVQKYR